MAKRSATVTKARGSGSGSNTPTIAAVAVIVVLAVVVFGGIFLFRDGSTSSEPIPPTRVQASYPVSLQGGVIVAGAPTAGRTLDVYEDALCPACRAFEQVDGQKIQNALNSGAVQVNYHMVNLLDQASNPPGYSTEAGNALMCAAENGVFPSMHASLYAAQPQEGAAGYTKDQLVGLGQALGAGPGFAQCVQQGTHAQAVAQNYAQASSNPALQQPGGGFGTPTIVADGRMLEPGSPELAAFLAG